MFHTFDAKRCGQVRRAFVRDEFARALHAVDHLFVRGLRGVAEREDAVALEDDDLRIVAARFCFLERRCTSLRQLEAGHDVRNPHELFAENAAADFFAAILVGDCEDRVGVGVIDELRGQERVEQGFDRRRRRARVHQREAELVHHLFVGQFLARTKRQEGRHSNGGQSLRLDGREIPTRTFDVEYIYLAPEEIDRLRLRRRVAAAMEDERGIAAEEARRVRAKGERLVGVFLDEDEIAQRRARRFRIVERGHRAGLCAKSSRKTLDSAATGITRA